jgi:hypothetical protein
VFSCPCPLASCKRADEGDIGAQPTCRQPVWLLIAFRSHFILTMGQEVNWEMGPIN